MSDKPQKSTNIPELEEIPPTRPYVPERQQAIVLLAQDGVPYKKIAKQLGIGERWVRKVLQKFRISPLTEPTIVDSATRTIRNHARGKAARKGLKDPRDTVIQGAAEYIHNTAFPPKKITEHTEITAIAIVPLKGYGYNEPIDVQPTSEEIAQKPD